MSKILGYSKVDGKDWFLDSAYSDKEIESIKDPEGGSDNLLTPAIPSPFARIDLVKTAFHNITKTPALKAYNDKEGNVLAGRVEEKLVSQTLDLAELLFNIDSINDGLRIIVWDKANEIRAMVESSDHAHRKLGDALDLYLKQDKESYNFELLDRIFLLEYKHKIIGATSPVTLFFPSGNDLTYATMKLTKNDELFGSAFIPLYERDNDFHKYIYSLFKANPILGVKMDIVQEYLNKNLEILEKNNYPLYAEIKTLKPGNYLADYAELDTGKAGEQIDVLGVPFRKRKKENLLKAVEGSDFRIRATKAISGLRPLVLQNNFNKKFIYINDVWNNHVEVPNIDYEPIEKRYLPGTRLMYPYLTVSDFLQPYLIRMVYPINQAKFFDGNLKIEVGDDTKGYLLPLKKLFFEYFYPKELVEISTNKPTLEMIQGGSGSVRVILRIPIEKDGEFINFERTYYQSKEGTKDLPQESENKGVVIEQQVGVTLFPFLQVKDPDASSPYRIQLIDRNVGIFKNSNYLLQFYDNDTKKPVVVENEESTNSGQPRNRTLKGTASDATSKYYSLKDKFEYIYINDLNQNGIGATIIPKWPEPSGGSAEFTFALDFGTTNTHIEYKLGSNLPKAFDIAKNDMQIATLADTTKTSEDFGGSGAIALREFIDYEFLPEQLGGDTTKFKFPLRTVSAEGKNIDFISGPILSLADLNIPFAYEKSYDALNVIKSNLKWAKSGTANQKRIRAYFDELFILMRNKVLLNNGSLNKTKLVWFYPASMVVKRKNDLERDINELFSNYFKPDSPPTGISESLAPFYFYKQSGQLQGGGGKTPVISIDIGGGTTDIVVFKSAKPILLSSFKFAANTIFGDGFSEFGANSNGFIKKYLNYFENLLNNRNQYNLVQILKAIEEKGKTEDIMAFLFSLESNYRIKDSNTFSLNSLLSDDDDFKILFLYFYAGVIYHIAHLMKEGLPELALPNNLVFSGTGSKILNIITSNMDTLSEFSKHIFEEVFNQKYDDKDLKIQLESNPKELTCKGGLVTNADDLIMNIDTIKYVYTGDRDKPLANLKYSDLDDAAHERIIDSVTHFNSFFLDINEKINFTKNFGISYKSIEVFKKEANRHLRDYLAEGIEFSKKLDGVESNEAFIEETLFFFPIIGVINNLSGNLSELSTVNV